MVNRSWIYRVLIYIHDTFYSIYSGGQSNHTKVGAHKNNASEIYRSSIMSNLNLYETKRDSFIFVTPPFYSISFSSERTSIRS